MAGNLDIKLTNPLKVGKAWKMLPHMLLWHAEFIIEILMEYGVTQSEVPEFFLNENTTNEPDVLPNSSSQTS